MKKILLIAAVAMSALMLNAQAWQIPVSVLGTYIESSNYDKLGELAGITSGSIEFNTANNTFTLTNVVWNRASAKNGSTHRLFTVEDGTYTFKFVGSNLFDNAKQQRAVFFGGDNVQIVFLSESAADVTIKGGNMLSMTTDAEFYLKDMTLVGDSVLWGIGGWGESTPMAMLGLDNANLTIVAKYNPVSNVNDIDFKNVDIVSPYGTMFSRDKKGFVDLTNTLLTDYAELKIMTRTTAVDNIKAMPKAQKVIENGNIYLIRGVKRFNLLGAEVK
ncbi:MAG: hypothetical protein IJ776_04475 [Paludibacteraceae bacterium]|nr:hypothetical protein [Paludibacteraceae bacterium]